MFFSRIDEFWSKYLKIKDIIDNPVIIGHNCGYKDDPELKPYSKETMQHCIKVADYLEIDVTKIFTRWVYSHFGEIGSKNRAFGIDLSSFLDEFKAAVNRNERKDIGLFLDMKWDFVSDREVNDFMKKLMAHNLKTTPIMICIYSYTFKPNYTYSILRLLRWFVKNQLWFDICPCTTIVIRSDLHEIFEMVANRLKKWFNNKKLRCAFNPNHTRWSLNNWSNKNFFNVDDKKFDFRYMIKHNIASYFWMADNLLDPDDKYAWLSIKQEIADRISSLGTTSKKFQWGIITYRPENLRNSKNQIEEWIIERRRIEEELAKKNEELAKLETERKLNSSYVNDEDNDESDDDDDDVSGDNIVPFVPIE